ncbi:hypothetical protein [Limnobacter sp.]|uniref:hypothetical protein n=1 Tax=Limnobacter sp. TaxID=2003368 RepID=UPI0025BA38C0|nr:hypothetical protein [Limnobacter sp.]
MVKFLNLRITLDGQEPFDYLINIKNVEGVDFDGNGIQFNSGNSVEFPFSTDDLSDYQVDVLADFLGKLIKRARLNSGNTYILEAETPPVPLTAFADL